MMEGVSVCAFSSTRGQESEQEEDSKEWEGEDSKERRNAVAHTTATATNETLDQSFSRSKIVNNSAAGGRELSLFSVRRPLPNQVLLTAILESQALNRLP